MSNIKHLHYALLPYISYGKENPDWCRIALVDEEGNVIADQDMPRHNWEDNENDCQEYWKHSLINRIRKNLINPSKIEGLGSWAEKYYKYTVDQEIYDEWYHYFYFIDGEDAHEFINACDHSQHSTHWQSRCGVVIGWKYYKRLKEHKFNTDVAAMFAYARGYLAGMESNSVWDHEGFEVLDCLGLECEGETWKERRNNLVQ